MRNGRRKCGSGLEMLTMPRKKETDAGNQTGKRRKPKKPKWKDDIDIEDIVPDFEEEDKRKAQSFTLSDEEAGEGEVKDEPNGDAKKASQSKEVRAQRSEAKRTARKERQKLEEIVDQQLLDEDLPDNSSAGPFRYRETSPQDFGMTPRDILMAQDAQLNQFVGLKKLATFRDPGKKSMERTKLSKKARLRKWRKETFGHDEGENVNFEDWVNARKTYQGDVVTGMKRKAVAVPGTENNVDAPRREKKTGKPRKSA